MIRLSFSIRETTAPTCQKNSRENLSPPYVSLKNPLRGKDLPLLSSKSRNTSCVAMKPWTILPRRIKMFWSTLRSIFSAGFARSRNLRNLLWPSTRSKHASATCRPHLSQVLARSTGDYQLPSPVPRVTQSSILLAAVYQVLICVHTSKLYSLISPSLPCVSLRDIWFVHPNIYTAWIALRVIRSTQYVQSVKLARSLCLEAWSIGE